VSQAHDIKPTLLIADASDAVLRLASLFEPVDISAACPWGADALPKSLARHEFATVVRSAAPPNGRVVTAKHCFDARLTIKIAKRSTPSDASAMSSVGLMSCALLTCEVQIRGSNVGSQGIADVMCSP